jgi:hypothetical protein
MYLRSLKLTSELNPSIHDVLVSPIQIPTNTFPFLDVTRGDSPGTDHLLHNEVTEHTPTRGANPSPVDTNPSSSHVNYPSVISSPPQLEDLQEQSDAHAQEVEESYVVNEFLFMDQVNDFPEPPTPAPAEPTDSRMPLFSPSRLSPGSPQHAASPRSESMATPPDESMNDHIPSFSPIRPSPGDTSPAGYQPSPVFSAHGDAPFSAFSTHDMDTSSRPGTSSCTSAPQHSDSSDVPMPSSAWDSTNIPADVAGGAGPSTACPNASNPSSPAPSFPSNMGIGMMKLITSLERTAGLLDQTTAGLTNLVKAVLSHQESLPTRPNSHNKDKTSSSKFTQRDKGKGRAVPQPLGTPELHEPQPLGSNGVGEEVNPTEDGDEDSEQDGDDEADVLMDEDDLDRLRGGLKQAAKEARRAKRNRRQRRTFHPCENQWDMRNIYNVSWYIVVHGGFLTCSSECVSRLPEVNQVVCHSKWQGSPSAYY